MNARRIVLAGLAAGLVLTIIDSIWNVAVFGGTWDALYKAHQITSNPAAVGGYWISVELLLCGPAIVWLYAALVPALGGGTRTALLAGFAFWFPLHVGSLGDAVAGLTTFGLAVPLGACELISALVAGLVGGRIYGRGERAPTAMPSVG